jgi:predicted ATP-dependent serine protease
MYSKGMSHQQIREKVMIPWAAKVLYWANSPRNPQRVEPPPMPIEGWTKKKIVVEPPKPAQPAGAQAITTNLSHVQRELLDWLWPSRIPPGKLTLLAGDPGLGKSFVLLDIAARVSSGAAWPDLPLLTQRPGGVVLFNAEDDLADTIAPRLDRAEANDSNIVAIEGVSMMGQRRHFSLECDLPRLAEVIETHPNTRLVVVDPISAYTGKIDSHNNSEVRGMLAPLQAG